MRGTFFKKPFEIVIETAGESWSQGETMKGRVSIKHHDSADSANDQSVFLVFSTSKDIKNKTYDKMQVMESVTIGKEEGEKEFIFPLAFDCPITEKASALYLACGEQEDYAGLLQLEIKPVSYVENYFQIIRDFFRFQIKTLKNKKNFVEATFKIPDTKEYTSLNSYKLLVRYDKESDSLELKHQFKLKKMVYVDGNAQTKDEKKDIKEVLASKDFKQFGDAPNQEGMRAAIEKVLEEVRVKPIM